MLAVDPRQQVARDHGDVGFVDLVPEPHAHERDRVVAPPDLAEVDRDLLRSRHRRSKASGNSEDLIPTEVSLI